MLAPPVLFVLPRTRLDSLTGDIVDPQNATTSQRWSRRSRSHAGLVPEEVLPFSLSTENSLRAPEPLAPLSLALVFGVVCMVVK